MLQSDTLTREQTPLAGGATLITRRGSQPGPTLALLGGVHGDKDEGVLAVQHIQDEVGQSDLTGTLRAVAPAKTIAWAAQSRTNPLDGDNLARCFPGNRHAGPTAVLAFGAPLIWVHPYTAPGRSLPVAADRQVPAIYAECSGGGSIRSHELDAYVQGVQAVIADVDMLPDAPRNHGRDATRWVYGSGDLNQGAQASHHGLFVSSTKCRRFDRQRRQDRAVLRLPMPLTAPRPGAAPGPGDVPPPAGPHSGRRRALRTGRA